MTQVKMLNQTCCLIFKGGKSVEEGFKYEECREAIAAGGCNWIGKDVLVQMVLITLGEVRHTSTLFSKPEILYKNGLRVRLPRPLRDPTKVDCMKLQRAWKEKHMDVG